MITKQHIFSFLIAVIIISCNSIVKNKEGVSPPSAPLRTNEVTYDYIGYVEKSQETEIIVKHKSAYSENFIQELRELGYEKFELIDSLLIIEDRDTAYFPAIPEIGKYQVLTGRIDDLTIAVSVERQNYTTINYKVEMVEFGNAIHLESGQADIGSAFFYGAESNTSERTCLSYFVTEYSDYKEGDCYTYIRLGYEEQTGPYLLGKLIKNCNGQLSEITLDNFPTLIEK